MRLQACHAQDFQSQPKHHRGGYPYVEASTSSKFFLEGFVSRRSCYLLAASALLERVEKQRSTSGDCCLESVIQTYIKPEDRGPIPGAIDMCCRAVCLWCIDVSSKSHHASSLSVYCLSYGFPTLQQSNASKECRGDAAGRVPCTSHAGGLAMLTCLVCSFVSCVW